MIYPKELFVSDERLTRQNIANYDAKQRLWYDTAQKLFPDYYKMSLRERLAVEDKINQAVGFKR